MNNAMLNEWGCKMLALNVGIRITAKLIRVARQKRQSIDPYPIWGHSECEHQRMRDVKNAERRGHIHTTMDTPWIFALRGCSPGSQETPKRRGVNLRKMARGNISGTLPVPCFHRGWVNKPLEGLLPKPKDGAGGIRLFVGGGVWLWCDGAKGAPRNENGRVVWVVWPILPEILLGSSTRAPSPDLHLADLP